MKLKILHVIASVSPEGGGPIEGIKQLGHSLRKQGHISEVVSLDLPTDPWIREFPFPVYAQGPKLGNYGFCGRLGPWLIDNAKKYDAVLINGLWQYHGFATRRAMRKLGKPYYVFAHGMLDPWFKRTYRLKHLKKWLYWPWGEYLVIRDAAKVFFTCEQERLLASQSFWMYRANEAVVRYGISDPLPLMNPDIDHLNRPEDPQGYLLFLSRIHPKKGVDTLIRALALTPKSRILERIVIAGPSEPEYLSKLQALAKELGVESSLRWHPMAEGAVKWDLITNAKALILPSHQENFGIVVAEALACGKPVLITDQVNIWREVISDGAGLVASDDAEGVSSLLDRWAALDQNQRNAMKIAARKCFLSRFEVFGMSAELIEIFAKNTNSLE